MPNSFSQRQSNQQRHAEPQPSHHEQPQSPLSPAGHDHDSVRSHPLEPAASMGSSLVSQPSTRPSSASPEVQRKQGEPGGLSRWQEHAAANGNAAGSALREALPQLPAHVSLPRPRTADAALDRPRELNRSSLYHRSSVPRSSEFAKQVCCA